MSLDCDVWRQRFDEMSFGEHKAAIDAVVIDSPDQFCYEPDAALQALDGVSSVVEIGGWRGELATTAFAAPRLRVTSWVNFETCAWAVGDGNRCEHERYRGVALEAWPWEIDLPLADLFMASHVIEHMRWTQFVGLSLQFHKYRRIHLQIPIPLAEKPNWRGYDGMHIFEESWIEVENHLVSLGLALVGVDASLKCRTYQW